MDELTIDDLFEYSNLYDVSYRMMDCKGLINFRLNKIWISPDHNDIALTYIHEIMHHHYKEYDFPESEIEIRAQEFYKDNFLLCEKIIRAKLIPSNYDDDCWD